MFDLKRPATSFAVFAAFLLFVSAIVSAQVRPPVPRPSQKATTSQTIGTTDVTLVYSRPAVKGRFIYGDWPAPAPGEATLDDARSRPAGAPLVPYGHLWRAGANEATMFIVNDDVLINGQPLAAGKYSFHAIPAKDGEWTLVFNKDDGQWGSFTYDATKDALRVKTKAQMVADSQEFLTYKIDNIGDKNATVVLAWEKARVPFTVEVKDVVGSTMNRLKAYVADAKADEWQRSFNAANYAKANKLAENAAAWYDQAIKSVDVLIVSKPTFANYRSKVNILVAAGKMPEALAAATKAVEIGKADTSVKPDDIAALEKRIADLKAGKL